MENKEKIEKIKVEIRQLESRIVKLENEGNQEAAKKRLWELFASCRPRLKEGVNSIFFYNGEEPYFEADFKNGYFLVRYWPVWSVFENEFGYNYNQIKDLCADMVENKLKWKGLTPN